MTVKPMTAKQLQKKIEALSGRISLSKEKRQQMKATEDQWSAERKELRTQRKALPKGSAKATGAGKPRAGRKPAGARAGGDAEE